MNIYGNKENVSRITRTFPYAPYNYLSLATNTKGIIHMRKSGKIFKLLLLSFMVVLFIVPGCADERKTKLEKGIGFMRGLASPNPAQVVALAHYNADSDPAGLVTLYHSNLEPNGSYPEAYSDRQSLKPWSLLVLPGNKESTMIVEGYGDDLKKPVIIEEITFPKRLNP